MDHLPQPSTPSALPSLVPCLCSPNSYDSLPFLSFPARRGWILTPPSYPTKLTRADNKPPASVETAAFLQSWLFFGLLTAVLDVLSIPLNPHDLVRPHPTNPGDLLVTTARLPGYLREWIARGTARTEKQRKEDFRAIQEYLMQTLAFTRANFTDAELAAWMVAPDPKCVVPLEVEMSILVLNETLDSTARLIRFGHPGNGGEVFDLSTALIQKLGKLGWCPSEAAMMGQILGNSGMWVAGSLGRKGLGEEHAACGVTKCLLSFVDESTYMPRHAAGCGGCGLVGADAEEVTKILESGGLPSIRIETAEVGEGAAHLTLTVVVSQPYVAISHVWAGGLGNTKCNSLPTCQLLNLRGIAMALSNETTMLGVWIDTLCVPIEPRGRKLALVRLVETYRAAETVLVLNDDMLQTTLSCSSEEKTLRICLSSWMRRLWTLEEGLIGREKLMFQFLEGAVGIPSPSKEVGHRIGYEAVDVLRRYLPEQVRAKADVAAKGESMEQVSSLLTALLYRSTTKTADEPLCLSHLLDIGVSGIVSMTSTQERMAQFLSVLADRGVRMPTKFLFSQGEKLQIPGFRWAPRSFMDLTPEDTRYLLDDTVKFSTNFSREGLQVRNGSGLLLKFGEQGMKKVIFFKRDLAWHVAVPVPLGERLQRDGRFWDDKEREDALRVEPLRDWSEAWRAFYETVPPNLAVLYDGLRPTYYGVIVAADPKALGGNFDIREDTLHGSIVGQVKILELRTRDHNFPVSNIDYESLKFMNPNYPFHEMDQQMQEAFEREFRPDTCSLAECVLLREELRWCVG